MNTKYKFRIILTAVCVMAVIFGLNSSLMAGDDVTPAEVSGVGTASPNIMFIFDNSDSMQDVPYTKSDGSSVRPDWKWGEGPVIEDGKVKVDASNNVVLDYSANLDQEIAIPKQTFTQITGYAKASTANATTISDGQTIIDASFDWSTYNATLHQYRRVRVIGPTSDKVQERSITGSNTGSKLWITSAYGSPGIHPLIDYTGYSKNANPPTFSYVILDEEPGVVTYPSTTTTNTYSVITDANVDWDKVVANWSLYNGAAIQITGPETSPYYNQVFKITGNNTSSKKWIFVPPLTTVAETAPDGSEIALPIGTTYRILSSENKDLKAYGGNHPSSKLYQAKKALEAVLSSDQLKDTGTGNYKINMGFATYLSARVPRVTAKYYRPVGEGTTPAKLSYQGYYKEKKDTSTQKWIVTNPDQDYASTTLVDDKGWKTRKTGETDWVVNKSHTGVSVGYTLERLYNEGKCDEQVITYKVEEINYKYQTDNQEYVYEFKAKGRVSDGYGYWWYGWKDHPDTLTVAPETCSGTLPTFPDTIGSATKVQSGEACYKDNKCTYTAETTSGAYYTFKYFTTYGDNTITTSSTPGYVDKDDNMVTPALTFTNNDGDWSVIPDVWMLQKGFGSLSSDMAVQCLSSDGTTWESCTIDDPSEKRVVMDDVCTKADCPGTTPEEDVEANAFDSSYFFYPGEGTTDRPHGWSYRKTSPAYIYKTHPFDASPVKSTWSGAITFPADSEHNTAGTDESNDFANYRGDDQVLFVNLPTYIDDAAQDYGDDVLGNNVSKILQFISSGATSSPNKDGSDQGDSPFKVKNKSYIYSMMPYTNSLAVNFDDASITQGKTTPLGASLTDAKVYYSSYYSQDNMSQQGCRGNYVILMTDGLEACDGSPKDVAAQLKTLFSTTPERGVKTFVIGFGMSDTSKAALNEIAVAGGTEKAYFASNTEQLVEVLLNDILNSLVGEGAFSQSSAVLAREVQTDDDLKIYYSYFDYPGWSGHMEGYTINKEDGSIGDPVSGWNADCSTENVSDAGCQITNQGAASRKIYTWIGNNTDSPKAMTEFKDANKTTLKPLLNISTKDIDGDSSNGTDADAAAVIGYVRDPGYAGGIYSGTRNPSWLLGDIWHSTPVVITAPAFDFSKDKYDDFKTANASRAKMIYVGANDGMLHAINDSNGTERWAYIPKLLLGKVNEFKEGHRYTVDGSIAAADLDITTGNTASWATVLVGGLRDGGESYYALNVTNPDVPLPMWEVTDANMGKTWSKAAMGIINKDGSFIPVVFVGGGYSPNTAEKGNRLYILDARSGGILKEFTVGGTMNNVPSEVLAVKFREYGGTPVDYAADTDLPADYKGLIEVVYFGDTDGAVWRIGHETLSDGSITGGLNSIEVSNNKYSTWDPKLVKLYAPAEAGHPIFHKPGVADYPDQGKCRFILFGTGNGANLNDTTQQYFCEILDDPTQVMNGNATITWKTGVDAVPALGAREQVLSDPEVFQGKVYFTTYQPPVPSTNTTQCADVPVGISYLYVVSVSTCSTTGGSGDRGSLGKGIATSPTIIAPKVYVHIEEGPPGDATPEEAPGWGTGLEIEGGTLKSSAAGGTGSGRMIYWRELE